MASLTFMFSLLIDTISLVRRDGSLDDFQFFNMTEEEVPNGSMAQLFNSVTMAASSQQSSFRPRMELYGFSIRDLFK